MNDRKMEKGRMIKRKLCCLLPCILLLRFAESQIPFITAAPTDIFPGYSPAAVQQAAGSITITSNRYSGPLCIEFTELSRSPASPAPAENADYGLFSADGATALSLDGSPSSAQQILQLIFPARSKRTDRLSASFLVNVFPATLPPPGIHIITLRADLYASSYPPSGGVVSSTVFAIRIAVGTFYDVSLVSAGSAFNLGSTSERLTFAALSAHDTRGMDLLVKSNIAYTLSISSVNSGSFINAADGTALAYALSADGTTLNLAGGFPALVAGGVLPTYALPKRFALQVTILPYTLLPTEGTYSDILTITLAAR